MANELSKITYLFGAGASAQTLPTIKGLPERIKVVKDFIEKKYIYGDQETFTVKDFSFKKNEAKEYLLQGLDKLYSYSHNHSTIDTYAKKLDLRGSSSREINELCFFLALYFNIEQKIAGVDSRYDTFFISILNNNAHTFPANLKFLSWNYDLQMEIAHAHLTESRQGYLNFDLFNMTRRDLDKNKFCSIKLNGSCNYKDDFRSFYPIVPNILISECSEDDLDFSLQYAYSQIKNNHRHYRGAININFAWYSDGDINKTVEAYNETEVLIVIGYSFPFFNREIDRKIIRAMTNLKKIYIQDLYPENIKSRFLSILPDWQKKEIEIIPVNDITEFFLPPEL